MKEIERKFLVKDLDFLKKAETAYSIEQAYLQQDPAKSVRVRIKGKEAFLTIKGISDKKGLVRQEWEYPIPFRDARALMELCDDKIEKTRYEVTHGKHLFEVDVFHGRNDGLVIAELELQTENELIERPEWLGKEITGRTEYYNLALLDRPYQDW